MIGTDGRVDAPSPPAHRPARQPHPCGLPSVRRTQPPASQVTVYLRHRQSPRPRDHTLPATGHRTHRYSRSGSPPGRHHRRSQRLCVGRHPNRRSHQDGTVSPEWHTPSRVRQAVSVGQGSSFVSVSEIPTGEVHRIGRTGGQYSRPIPGRPACPAPERASHTPPRPRSITVNQTYLVPPRVQCHVVA